MPVCNYLDQHKPATADATADCNSASSHECCSTDRHSQHMSRTYRNDGLGNFDQAFRQDMGTDVFDQESSSARIADDMNNDGFDERYLRDLLPRAIFSVRFRSGLFTSSSATDINILII